MAKTYISILAMSLLLPMIDTPALAYDTKVLPGATCGVTEGDKVGSLERYYDYILNVSNINDPRGAIHVVCPVVRDRAYNFDGIVGAIVYVRSDEGKRVGCAISSHKPDGTLIARDSRSTTSNTTTSLSLSISASASSGYHVIECELPPWSRLYNYRVLENEPTNANN